MKISIMVIISNIPLYNLDKLYDGFLYPLSHGSLFRAIERHFSAVSSWSLSVIINNTTWFLRLRLFAYEIKFFCIQWCRYNIKSNILVISFKFSPIFYPAGKFMSCQLYLSMWGLMFNILCGFLPISWWFNATVIEYWTHLLSLVFLGFIVAFVFAIHFENSIYELPLFNFISWKWMPNTLTLSNTKLLPFLNIHNILYDN